MTSQRSLYGTNEIAEVTGNRWYELALDTIKDPMIWFLIGTGAVFIAVGNTSEAIILFAAILPLLFMDAILHWRTQTTTLSLKSRLASQVTVMRENRELIVNSHELVPGDLLVVNSGLFLPADGIFQEISGLQIDESALTGEAFPVSKISSAADPFLLTGKGETPVISGTLGYAGTRALTGSGKMRVLFTGKKTSYGEIIQSVSKLPHERTPLQKSINKLVRGLIFAAAALCFLLAGVRIYQGHGWLDALLSAATLAIAAFPEEFPVVFTFFLGVGVYRLAKRKALVRRGVSVENIGRVTYICTDKTGTITVGVLQLTHLDPAFGFTEQDVLRTAFAASNPEGSDPVDMAIRDLAVLQKLSANVRLRIFPFTEERKQETAFVRENNGSIFAYMKGSPETVLAKSNLTEEMRRHWKLQTEKWAREGHKIIASAKKILTEDEIQKDMEPHSGFEFCGLLAFEDPPRPEVSDAIAYCRRNEIGVLMITGDHRETAYAIAKEVGLGGHSPVVISAEDEPGKFQEEWLAKNPEFLHNLHVVARCTPLQKLRIVNALKLSGELVAVTGDGVNDVPALKSADIGIAMGERGTRSAKEAASIILADDNFQTIVGAINEGRQLFKNLGMSFQYLLLIHIPFVLTAAFIPLLGYPLIYLPVHIVWLELIIHPSALLAFQQPANTLETKYRARKNFFNLNESLKIIMIGLALSAMIGISFVAGINENSDLGHGRAKAMAILTFWSAGLVAALTKFKTKTSILIFTLTLLSTVLVVESPALTHLLHLTTLHQSDWLSTSGWVIAFLLAVL